MEKVIVISTDSEDRLFVKTFNYIDDTQLQEEVEDYIGDATFFVIYEEDMEMLDEEITVMFEPINYSRKLSYDDAKTMKLMVKSGDFKKKEIAKHFGVSRQTVWNVCKDI